MSSMQLIKSCMILELNIDTLQPNMCMVVLFDLALFLLNLCYMTSAVITSVITSTDVA